MNFKNVTVAGSGVLGYQIAFQTAFHGFKISVYDINDEVLGKAKAKFLNYVNAINVISMQPKINSTIHLTILVIIRTLPKQSKMQTL